MSHGSMKFGYGNGRTVAYLAKEKGSDYLSRTEAAVENILTLPIDPEFSETSLTIVVTGVRKSVTGLVNKRKQV